jgi:hypothetical protein
MEQMLPEIRTQLKDCAGFTDDDIRESLWNNYFDVDPTLKDLTSEL